MALGAGDAVQAYVAAGHGVEPVIVGVDGTTEAIAAIRSPAGPFQATIVQDTRRIAETGVDLLLRMRNGETSTWSTADAAGSTGVAGPRRTRTRPAARPWNQVSPCAISGSPCPRSPRVGALRRRHCSSP
ncbi:hypothetical protein [Micromonospora sp. CPCC 206060]|uniref:hypothetical protein n=1 Tax=Micromonospora sp. CPCC 206060 TaxID=3122406 RepID=UPI003FA5FEFE